MTFTATEQVAVRQCPACGDPVEVEANFCPTCGTRQIDGIPRPEPAPDVPLVVPEHESMERETMAWALTGRDGQGAAGTDGDGSAAATMDDYAPLDHAWREKHQRVADQGAQDDSA